MNSRLSLAILVLLLAILGVLIYQVTDRIPTAMAEGTIKSSLHAAAEKGDVDAINRELKSGADPSAAWNISGGKGGMTPLMLAAQSGKADAVRAILAAKPDLGARGRDGQSALVIAAGWASPDAVQALLDAGAAIDARADDGRTALMIAAARGTPDTLQLLITKGADVHARNRWQQTALALAAQSGEARKVELLLAASADPNAADSTGITPLHIAAGADTTGVAVLKALIDGKADVNRADTDGVTPLMRAADKADANRVDLLLSAGADPKAKDAAGRTAADWAKQRDDAPGKSVATTLDAASK